MSVHANIPCPSCGGKMENGEDKWLLHGSDLGVKKCSGCGAEWATSLMPICQDCNIAMVEMAGGLILCPKCGVGLAESFQAIIDYMNPGGDGLQCFDLSEIEDHNPDEERMKFLASLGCPFELHVATSSDRVVQGYDSEEVKRGLW